MMTNINKVTKVQKFEMLRNWMQEIENANNDATIELSAEQSAEITMLCEFIDREMELLRNKSNKASGKPTKTQAANVELKGTILKVLANYGGEGRTRMKKLLVGKLDYICITWFIFVIGALAGLKIMEI